MTEWVYSGYVKVHGNDRRRMLECWDWKCSKCGYEVRAICGNGNKPKYECPKCAEKEKHDD